MPESRVPNLEVLRTDRGISHLQLAEAINVHKITVRRWESGESEPSVTDLVALSHFFGVSVDEVIGVKPAAPPPIVIRAADMTPQDLDRWVPKLSGLPAGDYCSDWALSGPLVERAKINIHVEPTRWAARCAGFRELQYGETALIAAMRAYVSSKLDEPRIG